MSGHEVFRIVRGLPFAKIVRYRSRVPGSQSLEPVDLTGFGISSEVKSITGDQVYPATSQPPVFAFATSIPLPQTGATKGVFHVSLTAAQTAAIPGDISRGRMDFIFIDSGDDARHEPGPLVQVFDPITALDGLTFNPNAPPTEDVFYLDNMVMGPQGSAGIAFDLEADLTVAGAIDLLNSSNNVVVTGLMIRAKTITGLVSVPKVSARRAADTFLFIEPLTLHGLLAAGLAFRLDFPGAIPVVPAGGKLQLMVDVAANATAFDVLVDILGYTRPSV